MRPLVGADRLVADEDDGSGEAAAAQGAGGGGGDVAGADDDEGLLAHRVTARPGASRTRSVVAWRGVTGSGATRMAPSSVTCTA